MVASSENFPLLRDLLADQQRLQTPAARAAEAFEQSRTTGRTSAVFAALIPLSAPGPGEQYAFEVALDACSGCKACVSACHSLNGLDDTETWRDVGLLVGGDERHPIQQTITTACHHCADPACLNGCPVLAYEKDPVTGIVRHLDDQCIGCQYCVLKCPYDVPKYNSRLGIVRKCDMCQSRLAEGEAPACVQACPTHAIRIVTITTGAPLDAHPRMKSAPQPGHRGADVSSLQMAESFPSEAGRTRLSGFLAAAPDPAYTEPTTRYVSRRPIPPSLIAADASELRVQPAHWPLVVMLTLLPLAVGCQLIATSASFLPSWMVASARDLTALIGVSLIAGGLGLAASVFHLGQPLRAWRIFLGWRTSWLSREAMVFGPWIVITALAWLRPQLAPVAAGVGVLGLFCSVMIYVDTRRVAWRFSQTAPRFFLAALNTGASASFALGFAPLHTALLLAFGTLAKLACEARVFRPLDEAEDDAPLTPALSTARILCGPLRGWAGMRVAVGLVAGLLVPALVLTATIPQGGAIVVFVGVLLAELTERALFFRSVDAPKMPGLPANLSRRS
ncbi:MAG: DmsC/YnfH family molybdoenzyme membrane anchor subunit [Opitutus sp.]